MTYTKSELWDWLKAERKWADKVRQWLRAEGVSPLILSNRRAGKPESPTYVNRAARRRMAKGWKRIKI